jgi:hypothetical protein
MSAPRKEAGPKDSSPLGRLPRLPNRDIEMVLEVGPRSAELTTSNAVIQTGNYLRRSVVGAQSWPSALKFIAWKSNV